MWLVIASSISMRRIVVRLAYSRCEISHATNRAGVEFTNGRRPGVNSSPTEGRRPEK